MIDRCVVIKGHEVRTIQQLIDSPADPGIPPGCAADIVNEVVFNVDVIACTAGPAPIIVAENVEYRIGMSNNIFSECHVLNNHPGGRVFLIADSEENGGAVLPGGPVVFEDVSLHSHVARILQLEDV